jgi:hypothetical protein
VTVIAPNVRTCTVVERLPGCDHLGPAKQDKIQALVSHRRHLLLVVTPAYTAGHFALGGRRYQAMVLEIAVPSGVTAVSKVESYFVVSSTKGSSNS